MKKTNKTPIDRDVQLCQQERCGNGFKYFFMWRGTMLTIGIRPRNEENCPREWCVEVSAGHNEQHFTTTRWAATKEDALTQAIGSWHEMPGLCPMPGLDWPAVTDMLRSARAL